MTKKRNVKIFDTTLRDGEQMPRLAFTNNNKLEIARKLDQLGVSVIEAGFPVNSEEEQQAVRTIASEVSATVCGAARVVEADIDAALKADVGMVDLICSTSEIQMQKSMNSSPEEVLTATLDSIKRVKDAGVLAMFTPMDATRTEPGFLLEVCDAAQKAGADWIGLTDTVGVGTPESIAGMVSQVTKAMSIPVSIHCHDDFGLAAANTISGVLAGADMAQVCINGLGERAGNASLEEVAMALNVLYGLDCGLVTEKFYEISRLVERISGIAVPPNKPVVGRNAFAHESGIHSAGIARDKRTFEPGVMTPEMVGHRRRLVVGKHAGRHGVAEALKEAGLEPTPDELTEIMQRVKAVAAKGKQITNTDLYAMAETVMQKVPADLRSIVLEQVVVTTGDKVSPTASIQAKVNGVERVEAQVGVGPVDAAFKAVQRMVEDQLRIEIAEFHVDAITGGSHATVRVSVTIEDENGLKAMADAAHADIVVASVDALLTATNHLIRRRANNNHH
ncbi:MAG: 2-isopropylmalate synthase [Desulfarculaceae bacterium]